MAASIFNGNFVKFLKNNLKIGTAARILTGTADPTSSAQDAEKGSLFLRQTGSGDGSVFVKLDTGSSTNWTQLGSTSATSLVGIGIDNGGSPIAAGFKGYFTCPFAGTITGWDFFGDTSGSAVYEIWKVNNAIPVIGDKISASAPATISAAQQLQSTTLTGWTTSVAAGDVFGFNLTSCSTFTILGFNIRINR